jgi:MscS family membrane protein
LTTLVFFSALNFFSQTWARSTESDTNKVETATHSETIPNTKSASDRPVEKGSKELVAAEQVGKKVGQKIDDITNLAASRLGSWIDSEVFAGVKWVKLLLSLLLIFAVLLIERIVRLTIERKRRKSEEDANVKHLILDAIAKPLSMFIWVYGIYFAFTPLFVHFRRPDGSNLVHSIAQKAADLGVAVALAWFIFKLVSIVDFRLKKWASSTDSTIDDILAPLVGKTLRTFIVIVCGILIIQNLTGVKIGPLLASLGIGGIAIALAAKDSIANFFGTLTILFDKPFQIGERVMIDKYDGVVENVGFRSTRIRTLTGHQVTIPNEKVVNMGLENVGKRPHIRWLTNITITYDTPPDKVEKAVSIIKEVLDNHEGMHPDFPPRVFFNGFNDWSLNILVVAWYHPADYWAMQEWQQKTCLKILRNFNDESIDFAFPSRTLYLANDDKRQLKLKMMEGETVTYIPERKSHK